MWRSDVEWCFDEKHAVTEATLVWEWWIWENKSDRNKATVGNGSSLKRKIVVAKECER